jgi:hypothetical protein
MAERSASISNIDQDELARRIIQHLGNGGEQNVLIYEICEQTGLPWTQVETLVNQVAAEQHEVVKRKQFPLMIVLALGTFLGGLALIGYGIYTTYLAVRTVINPSDPLSDLAYTLQYVFNFAGYAIALGGTGIAMMLGSLLGMKQVWAEILKI